MRQFRKRMLANGLAMALVLSSLSTPYVSAIEKNNIKFSDINGHWAENYIKDFVNKGYIQGYGDGTFKPNNNVTRAEFIRIVNMAFGFTQKGNENFSDVNKGDWYYDEVLKAVKQGYIHGYEDGTFRPNDKISREEACKIIGVILKSSGDGKTKFKDEKEISDWAIKYVDGLVDMGIIHGYQDNTFKPKNNATRAESVKTLHGAKDKYNPGDDEPPVINPTPPSKPETPVDSDNDLLDPNNPKWNIDSDKDGLMDAEEELIGTNPNKADTDEDGLNDKFEVEAGLDPTKKDSDENGKLDPDEDPDEDSLTNIEEQKYKTNPLFEDTDGDGLTDWDEINKYKTNPLVMDTDKDGLNDNNEIELGTDPNNKDTNGNGILDGNEKYQVDIETRASEKDENIELLVSGNIKGEYIDDIYTTNMENTHEFFSKDMPGYIGAPFRVGVDAEGMTQELELRFNVNPNSLKGRSIEDIGLYEYDKKDNSIKLVTNNITRTRSNEIKAKVLIDDFKEYIILISDEWNGAWQKELLDPETKFEELDIALTIDSSGSMEWNDPNDLRKEQTKVFVDKLEGGSRASVIDFDDWAYIVQGLTTDKEKLKSAIDTVDSWGGTDISWGLKYAISSLDNSRNILNLDDKDIYKGKEKLKKVMDNGSENSSNNKQKQPDSELNVQTVDNESNRLKCIMLLTDGESYVSENDPSIIYAKNNGIKIFTVGLGDEVEEDTLRMIAKETGGTYLHAKSADDLADLFNELTNQTIDLVTDTDGDGIPNYFERNLRLANGEIISLDPNNPDTDGDGLSDGYEITGKDNPTSQDFYKAYNKDKKYFNYVSRPDKNDTDGDGSLDGNGNDLTQGSNNNIVDTNPTIYDITDRMLLESADLSYISSTIKEGTEVKNIKVDNQSYNLHTDLTTANAQIKDFTIIGHDNGGVFFKGKGFGAIAMKQDDKLIVSFTGSSDLADWGSNIGMYLFLMPHYQQNKGVSFIQNILNSNPDIKEVYISGHSLGGLITQYTTNVLVLSNIDKKYEKFRAITFNSATFAHPNHVNDLPSVPLLDVSNNNQGLISDKDEYWSKVDTGILSSKIKHYVIENDFINYNIGARYLGNKPIKYNLGYEPSEGFKAHNRDNFYLIIK